jgi:DNA-binding NarL/FixJ family response regulator
VADPGFPLAEMGDPTAQRLMTHYAPGPNPAQPIIQALQGFLSGGLQGVANQQGIQTPDWSKNLGATLSSPETNAALGVMTPSIAGDTEKIAKLMQMIDAGMGQRAIAKELGVGRSSVQRYLQDQLQLKEMPGVQPSFWDVGNTDQLKELLASGLSQAKIADRLGTSTGNISSKMERLQKAGELSNYSRDPTPTMPALRFMQKQIPDGMPEGDPEYERALAAFLQ